MNVAEYEDEQRSKKLHHKKWSTDYEIFKILKDFKDPNTKIYKYQVMIQRKK